MISNISELFDFEDYEMKKSKRIEPQDRLSELPDSVILLVLSFLPMRDVVRTTLLSKRWKDLWTNIPCLTFKDDRFNSVRFQNFVNRALILWKGTKILKFDILFYNYALSASSDLDLWLRVAMENEVEELNVHLINPDDVMEFPGSKYRAPQRLCSCSSIRKLYLVSCHLKIHGNVYWHQLKSLRIEGVCLSEDVVNQILSGTPQLEVLMLLFPERNENLNIQSSSLKTLRIHKYLGIDDDDIEMDTVLRIWAPNVEMLVISGVMYNECLLSNVSSLTDATIVFSSDNEILYGCESHGEMLTQVFQSIVHVEKVTLSNWCAEVLGVFRKKYLLSSPSDARFLKLYAIEVNKIADLLEMFPKLTTLVIELSVLWMYEQDIKEPVVLKFDEKNPLKSKTNFPKSGLLHLRTVEITWIARDTSIYPLIEFLLKYASTLEKLVIRARRITSLAPESFLLASQKLLRMPRSSPIAEVILCEK